MDGGKQAAGLRLEGAGGAAPVVRERVARCPGRGGTLSLSLERFSSRSNAGESARTGGFRHC